ncbi:twin transmembrane helix small protein [Stenotrophomonas sp. MYb238]|jgi:succinate dehydrogenase/fumarate reductase cytochrome b subunit|uniref:twin transmembrane helix small protein n=1 Tax=Stenotrophomonas sp. MYb238 TaxID=2040281 RepID=UPI000E98DCE5|nr:twin transmembrane helix small protein [Stenotrophomonas sp. MYb238]MQP75509.1 twin transmembrane helix small protein [Stenotrophomonas sp. MYb238]HBN54411.1 twin transmembrane helix small protein [Stenotrophomonas sp.]
MNDSLKTLLVIAFLIVIVWNLGAGLYYLMIDRGQTKRTVNALTRRIVLSVVLILLVVLGIYSGWIKPHGVGG